MPGKAAKMPGKAAKMPGKALVDKGLMSLALATSAWLMGLRSLSLLMVLRLANSAWLLKFRSCQEAPRKGRQEARSPEAPYYKLPYVTKNFPRGWVQKSDLGVSHVTTVLKIRPF